MDSAQYDKNTAGALQPALLTAGMILLAAVLPFGVMTYRAYPGALTIAALLILAGGGLRGLQSWWASLDLLQIALLAAFTGWCLVSLAWTPKPAQASVVLAAAILMLLSGVVALWAWPRTPAALSDIAVIAFVAAIVLSAILIIVEMHSDMLLHTLVGARREQSKMNQAAVVISLWLWPVLLLVKSRLGSRAAWAVFAAGGVAILFSHSQTARLAFVVCGPVFALATWLQLRRVVYVTVGLAALLLVMPFLTGTAQAILPASMVQAFQAGHALERLIIWTSFSAVVPMKPILGFGFNSAGQIGFGPLLQQLPEALHQGIQDSHPHNMYLQVWVELGFVGAALLAAFLVRTGAILDRMGSRMTPTVLASLTAAAITALVGYGAWQAWWLAGVSALPLLFAVAATESSKG